MGKEQGLWKCREPPGISVPSCARGASFNTAIDDLHTEPWKRVARGRQREGDNASRGAAIDDFQNERWKRTTVG